MTWLLTGGAGYIGSHVLEELQQNGSDVVVVDDLSTGLEARVPANVPAYYVPIQKAEAIEEILREHEVTGVIHFAAKKAVGESVENPMYYYEENVGGLAALLRAMEQAGTRNIVFSSSAAVYGQPESDLVTESSPLAPESPYGHTKVAGEWMVRAASISRAASENPLSYSLLRYFNVAGAASPRLGDTTVANLVPMVFRALSQDQAPQVFGDDYPTPDGTCIRDYIHVVDLAHAHVVAAQACEDAAPGEFTTEYNVGTGKGSSVLEVLDMVRDVTGIEFDPDHVARRAGDPAVVVADPTKINSELSWVAQRDLRDMVESAWESWQAHHPQASAE